MKNIWLIMQREISVRVRRKAFILTTIITPILFAGMMVLPAVLMNIDSGIEYDIGVIDRTGILAEQIESTKTMHYLHYPDHNDADLEKLLQDSSLSAVLVIEKIALEDRKSITLYAPKTPSVEVVERINSTLNKTFREYKLSTYDIEELQEIMDDVSREVSIRTVGWNKEGEIQQSSTGLVTGIGFVLGFLIYIMIFASGSMVMNGVLQEKNNRIVEVLISSVRSIELMIGKIVGVASVVLIQMLLWGVLTVIFSSIAGLFISMPASGASEIGSMAGGAADHMEFTDILATASAALGSINFTAIIVGFIFYFIFGYLLYAAMFAAVGAAVDDPQDASQLLTPVTIPLILSIFALMVAIKAPDGGVAFWFSVIPFTSPIIMPTRLAVGVPLWELLLSGGLLIGTFVLIAWMASKIYVHGILIFGKKHGWKEIFRWIREKN